MRRIFWYWSLVLLCLFGCEDMTKKSENSIMGKKTQDVGEFKPGAGAAVSDSKVRADTPGLSGLQAYGPIVEQISKLGIDSAINSFYATEGRYPNSYEEFMTRIIKEYDIKLPVLPGRKKYQYDVENHKLVVIEAPAEGEAPKEPAAAPVDPNAAPANP